MQLQRHESDIIRDQMPSLLPESKHWLVAIASVALAFTIIPLLPIAIAFFTGAIINHKKRK
tara:strand:+ start:691 stop:873 length:183 start_codon:yes stop_codon:yes gene_type:complete